MDTRRKVVDVGSTDFTDVSAVVLSAEDLSNGIVSRLRATGFDLPLFVVSGPTESVDLDVHGVTGVLASDEQNADLFGRMVETAARSTTRRSCRRSSARCLAMSGGVIAV